MDFLMKLIKKNALISFVKVQPQWLPLFRKVSLKDPNLFPRTWDQITQHQIYIFCKYFSVQGRICRQLFCT